MFHNLKCYDWHLIKQDIGKFDVKIIVVPNELEKYMAFTIKKTLAFIDSMQFMDSSLGALVKTLSDNDFKYISQEFTGEQLKLVKQKGVYLYEYMKSLKTFSNDKLANRCEFYISLKDECITKKDYLCASDVCNVFKINAIGDYCGCYSKANVLI